MTVPVLLYYACTMLVLCLYYVYYACTMSTISVLCPLCLQSLYYACYACTMSTMPVLCLLCLYYDCTMSTMLVLCLLCLYYVYYVCIYVLCLFITPTLLYWNKMLLQTTVKDGLNIFSERFSKSFVVLSTKLHHIGFHW